MTNGNSLSDYITAWKYYELYSKKTKLRQLIDHNQLFSHESYLSHNHLFYKFFIINQVDPRIGSSCHEENWNHWKRFAWQCHYSMHTYIYIYIYTILFLFHIDSNLITSKRDLITDIRLWCDSSIYFSVIFSRMFRHHHHHSIFLRKKQIEAWKSKSVHL